MEEMLRDGFSLGGEQSGHIIFTDYLFTGDGLATALGVLRVMAATGRPLSSLAVAARDAIRRCSSTCASASGGIWRRCPRSRHVIAGRGVAARGPRPPAGALLGHRAAAAHHARRPRSRRDQALGERDRGDRETGDSRDAHQLPPSTTDTAALHSDMINLSVNVNKVATVRNSRGGTVPSVVEAAEVCVEAGAPGITVHPRADARHITFAGRPRAGRHAGAVPRARRVQHRRRSAAGPAGARARRPARPVHAGARRCPARSPARPAGRRHAASARCAAS